MQQVVLHRCRQAIFIFLYPLPEGLDTENIQAGPVGSHYIGSTGTGGLHLAEIEGETEAVNHIIGQLGGGNFVAQLVTADFTAVAGHQLRREGTVYSCRQGAVTEQIRFGQGLLEHNL